MIATLGFYENLLQEKFKKRKIKKLVLLSSRESKKQIKFMIQ